MDAKERSNLRSKDWPYVSGQGEEGKEETSARASLGIIFLETKKKGSEHLPSESQEKGKN